MFLHFCQHQEKEKENGFPLVSLHMTDIWNLIHDKQVFNRFDNENILKILKSNCC
jgi:hypothetical protein